MIDSKLESFSLVGTVPARGVVNSLQLLPAPEGFLDTASWPDTHGNRDVAVGRRTRSGASVREMVNCQG
ncbi:hypothetical protein V8E55_003076 [Tylopilus felleus]